MLKRPFVIAAVLFGATRFADAQPPAESAPSTPSSTTSSEAMEDPQVGDHWTYEVRDDISGDLKFTMVQTVTDISATDINIRQTELNNPGVGFLTFDRSWNVKNNGTWRYSPGDGTGIGSPFEVGKSWPVKSNDVNIAANVTFRRTGTSKVTARENVTTSAGTFNAYKIETSIQAINTKDPSRKYQVVQISWYAPEVDHWVKRSTETRIDGRLRDKSAVELVEYGRR